MFLWSTIFRRLLIVSLLSTLGIILLSVFFIIRMLPELQRPFMASKMLYLFLEQTPTENIANMEINGKKLIIINEQELNQPQNNYLLPLIKKVDKNHIINGENGPIPFGNVVRNFGLTTEKITDNYYTAWYKDGNYFIMPPDKARLSNSAYITIVLTVVGFILLIFLIFKLLRRLTRPFAEITKAVKQIEHQDLNYRIPLENTFGEYKELSKAFNTMTEKMSHVYEARKYLLLAIAHELRSPLARLKVRKDLINDDNLRGKMRQDINTLEHIIDVIMYTEHFLVGTKVPLDYKMTLSTLLDSICDEYASDNALLSVTITENLEKLAIPATRMNLLLSNLINNAITHGGVDKVDISIYEKQTTTFCIEVIDHGIGLTKDEMQKATQAFWRKDIARTLTNGNFGLGLYICKVIVDSMDGQIQLKHSAGRGLTVIIELPVVLSRFIQE